MLYNKDWWISVVAAGLVVSVIAAYLKDGISVAVEKIRDFITLSRKRRRRRRAKYIVYLSYYPTSLITYHTSALWGMIQVIILDGVLFFAPIFSHVMTLHPEWRAVPRIAAPFGLMSIWRWIALPMLLVSMIVLFSYLDNSHMARFAAWHEAKRRRRRQHSERRRFTVESDAGVTTLRRD